MAPESATKAVVVQRYGKRAEGVGSSGKVGSYYNTVPSWHPLRRYFLAFRGSSPWNRLVSASYGMLRVINYRELVPRYRVVGEVAERVVEQLRFGVQLDVLGPPRIGKSAGVTLGIVRRVVEYNIPNYTVIIATINRRVAVNLYCYLVRRGSVCSGGRLA